MDITTLKLRLQSMGDRIERACQTSLNSAAQAALKEVHAFSGALVDALEDHNDNPGQPAAAVAPQGVTLQTGDAPPIQLTQEFVEDAVDQMAEVFQSIRNDVRSLHAKFDAMAAGNDPTKPRAKT